MVDYQILFNIAMTVAIGLGGWVLGRITKSIDNLDRDLRNAPEKYVLKVDYVDVQKRIEHKLDQIFAKLDHKADK